jgi:multiple sugar transport system permease protein
MIEKYHDFKDWMQTPAAENHKHRLKREAQSFLMSLVRILILSGICYIILSPLIGVISNAFKSVRDVYNPLVYVIPDSPTFYNFVLAFEYMEYPSLLMRTLGFTLIFTVIQLVITSMVGYGFARFKFPGSNALFAIVIVTIVVPVHSYMIPMYLNFRYFLDPLVGLINSILDLDPEFEINLLNRWWSLGLLTATGVGLRSGLYIYIFRQFFRGLPKEIEEAAFIDGAGPFYTYSRVMMPNAMPAIVTVLLFAFVWHYNDTFYTSLLMGEANYFLSTQLMAVGLSYSTNRNIFNPLLIQMVVFGGVMLAIVPILTIYLFLQRYFVEGLERSGIVG